MRGSLTIPCLVIVSPHFIFVWRGYYTLPCEVMRVERCIITKMNLSLAQALRVNSAACVAFIGAGGKTTAMFQLARALSNDNGKSPVIVTATSHLGTWQLGLADRHILANTPDPIEKLEHGLSGVILITGEVDGNRTKPVNDHLINWLQQFCGYHSIPLL